MKSHSDVEDLRLFEEVGDLGQAVSALRKPRQNGG
jgi:hypothetical protein